MGSIGIMALDSRVSKKTDLNNNHTESKYRCLHIFAVIILLGLVYDLA